MGVRLAQELRRDNANGRRELHKSLQVSVG